MKSLKQKWIGTCKALGATRNIERAYEIVCIMMEQPHRHYHTLRHIVHALAMFNFFHDKCAYPRCAEMALWLHDIIYDTRAKTNEMRSAQFADILLEDIGIEKKYRKRICAYIRATSHEKPPENHDAKIVIDCDLAILAAPLSRFHAYERACRKEYSWVSDNDFQKGRWEILQRFLQRPRIFLTDEFQKLFERKARFNIAHSISAP